MRVTTVRGQGSTVLVRVSGEVADPPVADDLYECICAKVRAKASSVEVDLSDVEILTSVGITALLRAKHEAAMAGCLVTLVAASPIVRRVLDITGLTVHLGLDQG